VERELPAVAVEEGRAGAGSGTLAHSEAGGCAGQAGALD